MDSRSHITPAPAELTSRATVLDQPGGGPAIQDADRDRLIENYRGLIMERAIRYPVPYHFIRELGKGRQGVVFLAMRQGARGCLTRHAVKLFDPSIYASAESYWTDMGRMASQVSRLQPVQVDSIVSRDAYDECNGVGYIQMAAIDGVDIEYLLNAAHLAISRSQSSDEEWAHFMDSLFRIEEDTFRLQPGVALYILRKTLMGLQVMHRAGYIHGDVKPSNVMIDRMGSVKLVDFGRAGQIGERVSIVLGSPLYMAPEIHRLEPGRVQSDIYSAGLVCLELLCGEPFSECATMSEEQLLQYKMSLVGRLGNMLPNYVRENKLLVGILKRMLDPDSSRRFSSAEEAEDGAEGMRGVHRQLTQLGLHAEYDRELLEYLEKLSDPSIGVINPRLDWK